MTEPPNVEELPMLTRQQAVDFLRGRGFPVSLDALNRDPPQPMGRWGKKLLYEPRELLAWAARRMTVLPRRFPNMNDQPETEQP